MVSNGVGPTFARRQLGLRLRYLREDTGRTAEDLISAHVMSRTKLWRIESGRVAVKAGDVLALTRLYGTASGVVDELLALAEATHGSGYLEDYGTAVPEWVGLYAELEASASMISSYTSELIPGLLQTVGYTRAVMEADETLSPEIVERRVAFRVERQRRFFAGSGRLEVIATAGVMNLQVGSASVMEEQVAHLRAVNDEGAVRIGVLPATNGVHTAMRGPFVILDFDDPDDPAIAYVENLVGSRYIEKPEDLRRFRRALDQLRRRALPLEEWLR